MKYISKIGKISSFMFYIFLLCQLWHLCQYGGIRSHFFGVVICTVGFTAAVIVWLVSRRKKLEGDTERIEDVQEGKKISMTILSFILCTLLFGGLIIYSAIPYHGALSWKIDEWMRKKEVVLEHDNLFEDGVEGVLNDLGSALDLPEELYIANQFQVAFDENGVIQSIYAFIYGKDGNEEKKTYLIDYDADASDSMTVWVDGNANGQYEQDMRLSPMIEILNHADWKNQIEAWKARAEEQQIYEILYLGRRAFDTAAGLKYVPGDADGDGVETGVNSLMQLGSGGEIIGYEVSLHIPALDDITPVRYIMEPEYVSQKKLNEERQEQQAEVAQNTESWTVDQADGTMYFFLNERIGWRLLVTDAAAGRRFYELEMTVDGGTVWKHTNEDPFAGAIGVTEGLMFLDENFGFAGLTGASQSYSQLYMTRDGGVIFEKLQLPMDTVTELPELANECGFTIEDYDYFHMPEKRDSLLTIMVTTDAEESNGIIFQSKDNGATWEYSGNTQKMN